MTLVDIPFYITDEKDEKTFKADRKEARDTVRKAIGLYESGHLSEEMLRAITEIALAFEINEGIEAKFAKKNKKFFR